MAGVLGFEPRYAGIKTLCLTAWRHPNYIIATWEVFCRDLHGLSTEFRSKSYFKKPLGLLADMRYCCFVVFMMQIMRHNNARSTNFDSM